MRASGDGFCTSSENAVVYPESVAVVLVFIWGLALPQSHIAICDGAQLMKERIRQSAARCGMRNDIIHAWLLLT